MLDLTKLLKVGDDIWCDLMGECKVSSIDYTNSKFYLKDSSLMSCWWGFLANGSFVIGTATQDFCVVWPSKDVRTWENYGLKVGDHVWARGSTEDANTGYDQLFLIDRFDEDGSAWGRRYKSDRPGEWKLTKMERV